MNAVRLDSAQALAALDALLAKTRANPTTYKPGKMASWALAGFGAPVLPWPPSGAGVSLAGYVFDVAWLYGRTSAEFAGELRIAADKIAAMKPGWLGSVLGAIAIPASIAIAGAIAAPALATIGIAGTAGTSVLARAKSLTGIQGTSGPLVPAGVSDSTALTPSTPPAVAAAHRPAMPIVAAVVVAFLLVRTSKARQRW